MQYKKKFSQLENKYLKIILINFKKKIFLLYIMDDIDFKVLEEELAKIDPVELRYLLQLLSENAPVVEKIIKNVLDAPI